MFFEMGDGKSNAFRDGLHVSIVVVVNVLNLAVEGGLTKKFFDRQ